jgi:hypothetical protein
MLTTEARDYGRRTQFIAPRADLHASPSKRTYPRKPIFPHEPIYPHKPCRPKTKYKLFSRIVPKAVWRHRLNVKISNNTTDVNQATLMLIAASRSGNRRCGMAGLWIFDGGERRFIMAGSFDNSQSMLLTIRLHALEAASTGAN